MPTAIITGSGGLVGSECVGALVEGGFDVVGIDNDMRAAFFGPAASTRRQTARLEQQFPEFKPLDVDIRDESKVMRIFAKFRRDLEVVIHTAAQPSHEWAATAPQIDFAVNANGTLNLLEAVRRHAPNATFIFTSTNKVYGDRPNSLPLEERGTRFEIPDDHEYAHGIDTSMPIDGCLHSLFGVSKAAGDLLVQEYGRYYGMPTGCFRCGCLTGPNHAGVEAHGFLSYLMRCTVTGAQYTIFGYGGKQVRDNLHSADLVRAFLRFHKRPRAGAVYNIGGGRHSDCSLLEAIELCARISGKRLRYRSSGDARTGDHRWWISDLRPFQADYPGWQPKHGLESILSAIHDANADEWSSRLATGHAAVG